MDELLYLILKSGLITIGLVVILPGLLWLWGYAIGHGILTTYYDNFYKHIRNGKTKKEE